MSIDEETGGGGPGFERTPPSNIEAEQSVLGGMLLSKDAIADVVEILRSDDFYRPAHQMVYDVVTDLYGRGEPADAVTVFDELQKRGEMARVGGAAYLHTLTAVVPTAANAGYYAKIVREQAILRRLIEAGTRIVSFGYGGQNEEVDELVDRAQAEIYQVTERRTSEDYAPLADIMPGALDELEAIGSRGGQMVGVPTGFVDLDQLTNGLHPGQMIVVAARPAIGKALALDTPLPTPGGWTTMGEVRPGDLLIGADGKPTQVVAATEVMHDRPCFEVEFSDGTVIVADAEHQWLTDTRAATGHDERPHARMRTTEEIAASLRRAVTAERLDHTVANARPLDLPDRDLPIPPYTLGAWLGDRDTDDHGTADTRLGKLGVLGDKHIPADYLRASEEQRRALLAGLLDTDGSISAAGTVRLAGTNRRLAEDARELILSLGYQVSGPAGSTSHAITFTPFDKVFRLSDANARVHTDARPGTTYRTIIDVRPVASVPVRCVEVDNADRMYLAGRTWIPTHNSTLGLDFARSAAIKHGMTTVIFSLEMSRNEITMRLLSAEARVALHHMRSGSMTDDDWTRLARRMSEVAEAPLFIDDSPNMSMMEIRAKCRRLKQRNDLRFVVIDYLQLMSSPKKTESRQNEVSEISRAIKLLAKELEVPVIAISQLNRGPEQRTDKRPQVSDLRESGCMPETTTLLRADTGAPVTFRELLDRGHDGVLVWSLDEQNKLVPAVITNVFPSGVKEVHRLRLASGRQVEATANHPFRTFGGWQPLGELSPGDRVAVPRQVPPPVGAGLGWSEHRLGLLAHLIGAGSVSPGQPVRYTTDDEANLRFVEHAANVEFGITPRPERPDDRWQVHLPAPHRGGHPLHGWFGELGLTSRERRVPEALHLAGNDEIAVFLRHLWATGGTVTTEGGTAPEAYYATGSRALADGVALLLARFAIVATIRQARQGGYHVVIADAPGLRTFGAKIGVHGRRGEPVARLLDVLRDTDACQDPARDDVFWDRVVAIEPLGSRPVYDATVKGTHNFVADGIIAHNSIEQDADMVILLHREDAYEPESPRAGEADLIVAKHRNGPTATVTVAFQGHYSRFVDMAQH